MRGWAWAVAVLALGFPGAARAEEDPVAAAAKLYDLVFQAEPATLAPGAAGRIVVRILPKADAEVHQQAPISLSLKPSGEVTVAKPKLGRADLKMDGVKAAFEIPVTAGKAGKASVVADLDFYICTARACTKQIRQGTVDLAVK